MVFKDIAITFFIDRMSHFVLQKDQKYIVENDSNKKCRFHKMMITKKKIQEKCEKKEERQKVKKNV